MVKNIYLVRHAHYRIPHPRALKKGEKGGTVLTVRGIEDIIELAHKLRHEDRNIKMIYASPYKRTLETADLLIKILRTDIILREGIQENYLGEGKEDHLKDVYLKFKGVVEEALDYPEGHCVIVSHKLPISLFVSRETGVSYKDIAADRNHINLVKMGDCLKLLYNRKSFIKYEKF